MGGARPIAVEGIVGGIAIVKIISLSGVAIVS